MIQDIKPHVYDNAFHPKTPEKDDVVFGFDNDRIFLKPDGTMFRYGDLKEPSDCYYLFRIDDTSFFLTDLSKEEKTAEPVRILRTFDPKYLGFAGITAWQLYGWIRENSYCGKCGKPMSFDSRERAMRCEECGHIVYPKIMPAVIVGVLDRKGRIVVTQFAHRRQNHYALISGFTEVGETIEETVKREVLEEVGLHVTNIRYYKSQPWSFSSTLLLGFFCDVEGDETITVDTSELKTAKWAGSDEDIGSSDGISLTSEMIGLFRSGKVPE